MKTPFLPAVIAIAAKDLRAETRSRELLSLMTLFALLSILVFSFALDLDKRVREESVSGVFWVTLIFASLLGFNRSMAQEQDSGALDAILLTPTPRGAIFLGKLLSNAMITLALGLILLPLMTALYGMNLLDWRVVLTTTVGVFGFCAIGTLLAALTSRSRAREALLPIALLPIALPFVLMATRATKAILAGAPAPEWQGALFMLAAITAIYLALCLLLFGYVVEE